MENIESQKGIALYIALVIMAFLLAIGLGLSVIISGQLGMIRDVGNSVVALYAADTGIEHALYNRRKLFNTSDITDQITSQITYSVIRQEEAGLKEWWESSGTFANETRAIRIDQGSYFDFLFFASGSASFRKYDDKTYYASWCPFESPEPIRIKSQLVAGVNREINYEYNVTDQFRNPQSKITVSLVKNDAFTPFSGTPGCNSSNPPATVNCSARIKFTINTPLEIFFFILTIKAKTDILEKSFEIKGDYNPTSCGPHQSW